MIPETDPDEFRTLLAQLGVEFAADLSAWTPAPEFWSLVDIGYARRKKIIGLRDSSNALRLAICDREGWGQVDVITRLLKDRISPLLTTEQALTKVINSSFEARDSQAQEVIDQLDVEGFSEMTESTISDLLDSDRSPPVVKLVNMIMFDAVRAAASDIHIQPYEDRLVVRLRIDGVLFDAFDIPKPIQEEVLTRIKVLGKMDVAEKRLPQDGRATIVVGDRVVDLRIASLPTSHNERIVIRLLDKSARLYTLGELGMSQAILDRFGELISLDHGLMLVTGPTGSGKSTTLYASLQEINKVDLNVLTLEDPIEYQLSGVSQTQINEKKGMTFASGLRSILRQDPDIIMVGEIRDSETAVLGIQASLTGHMVFSTLHTNDAASAVTRLLELGIEPYLVSSSVVAVLAQRLVRKICPDCKHEITGSDAGLRRLGYTGEPTVTYGGRGCVQCRETGYRGRIGLFELLVVDDECRQLIQSRANAATIRTASVSSGMRLLREDGLSKVIQGATTVDEILRVAGRTITS